MPALLKGMTKQDFADNADYVHTYLKLIADEVPLSDSDLGRGVVQFCIDNGKQLLMPPPLEKYAGVILFSPVLTEAQLNQEIPASWNFPGDTYEDDEGNEVRRTFGEYYQYRTVEGGYCLQYGAGYSPNSTTRPSWSQLLIQIDKFKTALSHASGFMTLDEVEAIEIVEEP